MSYKYNVCVAVNKLGMFHGRAYTMKEKNLKKFQHICGLLQEIRYQDPPEDSNLNLTYDICAQRGLKNLRNEYPDDDNMQKFVTEIQVPITNMMLIIQIIYA